MKKRHFPDFGTLFGALCAFSRSSGWRAPLEDLRVLASILCCHLIAPSEESATSQSVEFELDPPATASLWPDVLRLFNSLATLDTARDEENGRVGQSLLTILRMPFTGANANLRKEESPSASALRVRLDLPICAIFNANGSNVSSLSALTVEIGQRVRIAPLGRLEASLSHTEWWDRPSTESLTKFAGAVGTVVNVGTDALKRHRVGVSVRQQHVEIVDALPIDCLKLCLPSELTKDENLERKRHPFITKNTRKRRIEHQNREIISLTADSAAALVINPNHPLGGDSGREEVTVVPSSICNSKTVDFYDPHNGLDRETELERCLSSMDLGRALGMSMSTAVIPPHARSTSGKGSYRPALASLGVTGSDWQPSPFIACLKEEAPILVKLSQSFIDKPQNMDVPDRRSVRRVADRLAREKNEVMLLKGRGFIGASRSKNCSTPPGLENLETTTAVDRKQTKDPAAKTGSFDDKNKSEVHLGSLRFRLDIFDFRPEKVTACSPGNTERERFGQTKTPEVVSKKEHEILNRRCGILIDGSSPSNNQNHPVWFRKPLRESLEDTLPTPHVVMNEEEEEDQDLTRIHRHLVPRPRAANVASTLSSVPSKVNVRSVGSSLLQSFSKNLLSADTRRRIVYHPCAAVDPAMLYLPNRGEEEEIVGLDTRRPVGVREQEHPHPQPRPQSQHLSDIRALGVANTLIAEAVGVVRLRELAQSEAAQVQELQGQNHNLLEVNEGHTYNDFETITTDPVSCSQVNSMSQPKSQSRCDDSRNRSRRVTVGGLIASAVATQQSEIGSVEQSVGVEKDVFRTLSRGGLQNLVTVCGSVSPNYPSVADAFYVEKPESRPTYSASIIVATDVLTNPPLIALGRRLTSSRSRPLPTSIRANSTSAISEITMRVTEAGAVERSTGKDAVYSVEAETDEAALSLDHLLDLMVLQDPSHYPSPVLQVDDGMQLYLGRLEQNSRPTDPVTDPCRVERQTSRAVAEKMRRREEREREESKRCRRLEEKQGGKKARGVVLAGPLVRLDLHRQHAEIVKVAPSVVPLRLLPSSARVPTPSSSSVLHGFQPLPPLHSAPSEVVQQQQVRLARVQLQGLLDHPALPWPNAPSPRDHNSAVDEDLDLGEVSARN